MQDSQYKLVAPDIDRLLNYFDRGYLNPSGVTQALSDAMEPLFELLSPLAPLKSNKEVKSIWLMVPRGDIADYDSFEEVKEYAGIQSYEEYENLWKEEYPQEKIWYKLLLVDEKNKEGQTNFRAVVLGDKTIINAQMDEKGMVSYSDEAAEILCNLIAPAVKESLDLLKSGAYNTFVNESLPYQFRKGVIKRSDLWKAEPEYYKEKYGGLSEKTVSCFRKLLESGVNDESKIRRIKSFTANDFFKACELGYKALDYDTSGMSLSELYLKYADGRDEGLTGTGHGLNEGPGIDFDDEEVWNVWYFGERGGGHPWEIIRGGNSTHVDLFVYHDENHIGLEYRLGKISEKEYREGLKNAGYYFRISGKHWPLESVTFYTVLSEAGLPVILDDADEILARFDGSDYIGIVPHSVIPKYCEGMFPKEYGHVIDFMHVYDEEMEKYGDEIIWIPEDDARLIS